MSICDDGVLSGLDRCAAEQADADPLYTPSHGPIYLLLQGSRGHLQVSVILMIQERQSYGVVIFLLLLHKFKNNVLFSNFFKYLRFNSLESHFLHLIGSNQR